MKKPSLHLPLLELTEAHSPEALKQKRIVIQQQLYTSLPDTDIREWVKTVNEMHDAIMQQAVTICEQQLLEAGYGPPPVAYSFIVFGSAGRLEQTLWSDQDNGLIISDEQHEQKERYFQAFGSALADMLEQLGYEKCQGKVMCSEPLWRKTLQQWQAQLDEWRQELSWEPVRNWIIASDMRHIAGDEQLSQRWIHHFYDGLQETPELSAAILRNTVRHKATLNVLGQIVPERFGEHAGDFDVKYGIYIPLVNASRFLALQNGIRESSTLKRLERLIQLEAASLALLEMMQDAFRTSLRMRNSTPIREIDGGLYESSGFMLQKDWRQKPFFHELRESLGIVKKAHRVLQRQLRFLERRRL
ncbi:DUF294 nucleotidyltransferase-like domain-containing protein [Paenibacillus kandeliae]|uniref:DUF294 nucleotidyltransferase-like domain-containing protein n=1 Tax=Paenibacillus kandeliae TaxID=3231269 RepID=UPI003458FA30